jgi:hypothetical protein
MRTPFLRPVRDQDSVQLAAFDLLNAVGRETPGLAGVAEGDPAVRGGVGEHAVADR